MRREEKRQIRAKFTYHSRIGGPSVRKTQLHPSGAKNLEMATRFLESLWPYDLSINLAASSMSIGSVKDTK